MSIIGPVVGTPSNKFTLPRSYIYGIGFPTRIFPMVQTGPHFIFNEALHPEITYHIIFRLNTWLWTSNSYSLDYWLTDAYGFIAPDPTPIPAPTWITYVPHTSTHPAFLKMDFYITTSDYTFVNVPVQPPHWWLPKPLP